MRYEMRRTIVAIVLLSCVLVIGLTEVLAKPQGKEEITLDKSNALQKIEVDYKRGKISYEETLLLKAYTFVPNKLPAKYRSDEGARPLKCGNPVIEEILKNYTNLSKETQREIAFIFERPGTSNDHLRGNPKSHILPQLYETEHFVIHWTNGSDGGDIKDAPPLDDLNNNNVPDYVEKLAGILEYVWSVTNKTYGYPLPPSDASEPNNQYNTNPNGKYDVFIHAMDYCGYTIPEQWNPITHPHGKSYSYIGINNKLDYQILKVTAAHEFFHAIQFYYDCGEQLWWKEATAVWMEDEIYDEVNDYINYINKSYYNPKTGEYIPAWVKAPYISLTTANGWHEYGDVIFAKFLSERMGRKIIKDIWEEMVFTDGITAIDNVLKNKYGTNFKRVFINFIIANYLNSLTNHDNNTANDQYEEGDKYDDIMLTPRGKYFGGREETLGVVDQWAANYINITPDADTLHFKLDKDYCIISIRITENNEIEVRELCAAELKKYQLNETLMKEILNSKEYRKMLEKAGGNVTNLTQQEIARTISAKEMEAITPNNTVTNADKYKKIVLIISPLDKKGGAYTLTLDEVQKRSQKLKPGERAVYVIPAWNLLLPFYLPHGDVFVSAWWDLWWVPPENISVNLTPVGFSSEVIDIPSKIDYKIEKVGKLKLDWKFWSCIWKLEIMNKGTWTTTVNVTSNYYDRLLTLPTRLEIYPIDMFAGTNSSPRNIEFRVIVFDGSENFSYDGFPKPSEKNFEVKIGDKPAQIVSVYPDNPHEYVLTVKPPAQPPGKYNLTVNFTFEKFGVSSMASASMSNAVEYGSGKAANVDVALIIDSSGSMSWNDPNDLRKSAAKLFVDLLSPGDRVAVVDFDEDVVVLMPLREIRDQSDKDAVKAAIDRIDSSGWTNIGGGLFEGFNELNSSYNGNRKVAILLTDGYHNTGRDPSDVVPLYKAKGWPVYTIALTGDADENLLRWIASETGGKYYKAPTAAELQQIYNEIKRVVKKQELIEKREGLISQGESVKDTVTVDSTVKSMDIALSWEGSDLDLILYYPNGTRVELNASTPTGTEDPNIIHREGATYEAYTLINPAPGNWSYEIIAVSVTGFENYTLVAAATTTATFSAGSDKDVYYLNEPVKITAVFLNGTEGIEGATVIANITQPNMVTESIAVVDSGGGLYEAMYTNTSIPGIYSVEVKAVKGAMERMQVLTFEVLPSEIGIIVEPGELNLTAYQGGVAVVSINITNLGITLSSQAFRSLYGEMGASSVEAKYATSSNPGVGIIIQPMPLVSKKFVINATSIIPEQSLIAIPGGGSVTVNITIYIPRYAPPGNYTSLIKFISPEGSVLVPLNVTVSKVTKSIVLQYIKESYEKWKKAATEIEKDYYIQKMADDLVMFYYAGG